MSLKKWHGGKGDTYRAVDKAKFDSNFDAIFGKNDLNHYCVQGGHTSLAPNTRCDWCGDTIGDEPYEIRNPDDPRSS